MIPIIAPFGPQTETAMQAPVLPEGPPAGGGGAAKTVVVARAFMEPENMPANYFFLCLMIFSGFF